MRNANSLGRDHLTSLVITGGRDYVPGNRRYQPDLLVRGGAKFNKTVCILQDLTVHGNTYLGKIVHADTMIASDKNLNLIGNVLVNGLPIQGNCNNICNISNLTGSTKVHTNSDETISMETNGSLYVTLGPNGEWQQGLLVSATAANSHAEGEGVTDIAAALAGLNKIDIDGRTGLVLTTASGLASHAEGTATIAAGVGSHAEGGATQAIGYFSHAEGLGGKATGIASHVEGDPCFAEGDYSHAEGQNTHTSITGLASHTEGRNTFASALAAHAEGNADVAGNIWASNIGSHAEGYSTGTGSIFAIGLGAHAEGFSDSSTTYANGNGAHAEGHDTKAHGTGAHSEGDESAAVGEASHAEGSSTMASANSAHSEGTNTFASGHSSHAEGLMSSASAESAHAEGTYTSASGIGSHAEGLSLNLGGIVANGIGSHVEGCTESSTTPSLNAFERGCHVEGYVTDTAFIEATAPGSHAEGRASSNGSIRAIQEGAHAEGFADAGKTNVASGYGSHAEGTNTSAIGNASHAGGFDAVALNNGQQSSGTTQFAHAGDAQFNRHIVKASLAGAGTVALEDIINGHIITVPNNTSWIATIKLIGVDITTDDTYCAVQNIKLKNVSNVLTNAPMASDMIGEGTLSVPSVTIDYGSSGATGGQPQFTISVTTSSTNATRWVATVESTQIGRL